MSHCHSVLQKCLVIWSRSDRTFSARGWRLIAWPAPPRWEASDQSS